jgi:hypothetical protein
LGRPQASFAKRQREQAKKEKKQLKAERREQRKTDEPGDVGGPPIIADDPADFGPTKE